MTFRANNSRTVSYWLCTIGGGGGAIISFTFLSAAKMHKFRTVTNKFRHLRGLDFLALPRRERQAYPLWVCEERATTAAAKKTATRRAAPELTSDFVALRSQSAGGYAPSSRLARGQFWRSAGIEIYLSQYWEKGNVFLRICMRCRQDGRGFRERF